MYITLNKFLFFFHLLVYPGKMLQLLLLRQLQLYMWREKIHNEWLPKTDLPSDSCVFIKTTERNKVHFAY